MRNKRKVLLIDFMYLWNRLYSVRGDKTADCVDDILRELMDDEYYWRKYVILDGKNSVDTRREIYPAYKKNRTNKSKCYEALYEYVDENVGTLKGLHFMSNDTLEADDVITEKVQEYSYGGDKFSKYIYSGDTDLHQLLRFPNTYISDKFTRPFRIIPIDEENALERYSKKYNIEMKDPSYITKCKMFKGDSGDNIPVACPGLKSTTISTLIENCWSNDEPLTSKILYDMAKYLKLHGTAKEFEKFYNNRHLLARNYKLTQLGYPHSLKVSTRTKLIHGREGDFVRCL